ncbi:hypothetical protein ID866_12947 [Astraeus odoratus]|nr:hypothetical protein ID866_12947 [Astraeus odoratus]
MTTLDSIIQMVHYIQKHHWQVNTQVL